MKACLTKLGLEVSEESIPVPSLSRLHLSCAQPSDIADLVQTWHETGIIVKSEDDGLEYIKGENDTFRIEKSNRWSMSSLTNAVLDIVPESVKEALPSISSPSNTSNPTANQRNEEPKADSSSSADRILDYDAVIKQLVPYETSFVPGKETPHFNHAAYFSNLKTYQSKHLREASGNWRCPW